MFRATKIEGYLKAMQRRGIGSRRLLADTDIDADLVSSPDYLISLEQYQTVALNMMELTGEPGIAFSLEDICNLNEIGIVGYAMISANSLRQAVDVWLNYSDSLIGTPINIESFHALQPGYELVITSPSASSALHRFETEELLVQGTKLVRDLTGVEPLIGKVALAYPEPPHRALYEEFFKCPIEFGAARTTFRVLKPDIDAPIATRNEELFRICSRHCKEVLRSMPGASLLRSRLRNLFLASPGNLPDLNTAAAALGMSASTLRRQLDALEESYQGIKDEFRFDLAREFLRSGHLAPKQVAYLLGYASPSAFSRAFKGWTGQTVGQFMATDQATREKATNDSNEMDAEVQRRTDAAASRCEPLADR